MGSPLPDLSLEDFARRLRRAASWPLAPAAAAALHRHYLELRRWNPRLSLVGPGTAAEVVERHYGESLAALPLIEPGSRLLDVGSGAGFPGFVLAAAEPSLACFLVESRQRKWAFLEAARRATGLACECLNATVGEASEAALPAVVDVITVRALKLPPRVLAGLAERLAPQGSLLLWGGESDPVLPSSLAVAERHPLAGRRGRLLRVVPERR